MELREQDKHFLSSLYAAIAVIFAWKGLWEGIYTIPYINDSWVILFIGFAMLTLSGLIFKEFDPLGGIEKSAHKTLNTVFKHPEKKHFTIKYYDKSLKKQITIEAQEIKKIEKEALIIIDKKKKQELFIPAHRVTEIFFHGKSYWKL